MRIETGVWACYSTCAVTEAPHNHPSAITLLPSCPKTMCSPSHTYTCTCTFITALLLRAPPCASHVGAREGADHAERGDRPGNAPHKHGEDGYCLEKAARICLKSTSLCNHSTSAPTCTGAAAHPRQFDGTFASVGGVRRPEASPSPHPRRLCCARIARGRGANLAGGPPAYSTPTRHSCVCTSSRVLSTTPKKLYTVHSPQPPQSYDLVAFASSYPLACAGHRARSPSEPRGSSLTRSPSFRPSGPTRLRASQ